jgi:hypothetical protein
MSLNEGVSQKIKLNLEERLFLINVIGNILSKRDTLVGYVKLLDELVITKSEATDNQLDISYDESKGGINWNREHDIPKDIVFTSVIFNDIVEHIKYLSSGIAREVYVKFVGHSL